MYFGRKRVYLDWAASAPVNAGAARAYSRAIKSFGNPSSAHAEGRDALAILTTARTTIARELGMKADDIIFTSGATEANNLAITGHVRALIEGGKKPEDIHLLYLPSAHASTVETIRALGKEGVMIDPLPIENGQVDIKALASLIRKETALVSMDFVCSETGTIWNTREVGHALPSHTLLHVDASQAPLEESLERSRLGADMITLDAQKVGGVRGTGVLAVPRAVPLASLFHGGGQERALRAGTEPVAGAAAFAFALTDARETRADFVVRSENMRARFIGGIKNISNLHINQGKKGIAHIVNISLIGRDTDYLAALLDEAGFAVSTKSACETDSVYGSRAVLALTGDTARATSTLRISWGPATSERELMKCAGALITAVAFLDEHGA